MKKVLVANIFGIGDVLFTSPVIANLRAEFPGVSIDYLCNARCVDIVRAIPGTEKVLVYEKDHYTALWKGSKANCLKEIYGLFREIRDAGYNAVFDMTNSREFGLAFKFAGIPRRIGMDYNGRGIFLTDKIRFSGFTGKHVVEHYLDLLEHAGISSEKKEMALVPDKENSEWAENYLRDKGLRDGEFAAIIPGGGASWGAHASRKRWRAEGFSAVAEALEARGIRTVILGDSKEKSLCDYVASEMAVPPAGVENGLSLGRYMALISKSGMTLCNDGGPLHIAVALGKKTVSIFGPVDEKVYGPYPLSDKHRVVKVSGLSCRPCYDRFKLPECKNEHRCVVEISPAKVTEACVSLLSESKT